MTRDDVAAHTEQKNHENSVGMAPGEILDSYDAMLQRQMRTVEIARDILNTHVVEPDVNEFLCHGCMTLGALVAHVQCPALVWVHQVISAAVVPPETVSSEVAPA